MDDKIVKEALSYTLGSDLHEAWCEQELRAFFARAQQEYAKSENFGTAFKNACYKNEQKRNEVELDTAYLVGHETLSNQCLTDFNVFMSLFDKGAIEVKRFTKRELTSEEIQKAGNHYVDGSENILRDFGSLSSASQKDNLEAARFAIEQVYDKTISGECITPEELEQMGSNVHEEWLKRNPWVFDSNYGDPRLAVPYQQLSKEDQDKDKAHINLAQAKVQAYMNGLIDVEKVCAQYGIEASGKSL